MNLNFILLKNKKVNQYQKKKTNKSLIFQIKIDNAINN